MGYRALLFCPDERTAQAVTLVLNDLEFTVEVCSEPFVAVKKLMGEHFDGLVVDCDSEQNAALLFKSARQSVSNAAALAVAVVEGQAGVAKAFRLGANLVLTKPINVEQAKGTLRVARGLLRKGESAKGPVAAESSVAEPGQRGPTRRSQNAASSDSSRPVSTHPAASKMASAASAPVNPWGNRVSEVAASASFQPGDHDQHGAAVHLDVEVDDTDTADERNEDTREFQREVPALGQARAHPTAVASPNVSASRNTAFAAIKQSSSKTSIPFDSTTTGSVKSKSAAGAATAAAPSRLSQAPPPEPLLSKIARTVPPMDETKARSNVDDAAKSAAFSSSPTFGDLSPNTGQRSSSGPQGSQSKLSPKPSSNPASPKNKKVFLAVAVAVLFLAALYFAWTQMHGQIKLGSTLTGLISQVTGTQSQPSPASDITPATPVQLAPASRNASPVPTQNSQSLPAAKQTASVSAEPDVSTQDDANDVTVHLTPKASASSARSSVRPLLVKSGDTSRTNAEAAAPSVFVSPDGSGGSLPNLIVSSASATAPVLQAVSVSQGVSQGLILKRVQPTYPAAALRLHLEGPVQLLATVGKSGGISSVKTMSGEPVLAHAAADAVRQWKYKPYLLNGQPVEIQTQITINFKLPR